MLRLLPAPFFVLTTFLLLSGRVHATALTSILAANERSCYYADVDGIGEKVGEFELELFHASYWELSVDFLGFYFAVQSGGSFEIDYVVMDPDDKILLEGTNERQGDYIFTANKVGLALPSFLVLAPQTSLLLVW